MLKKIAFAVLAVAAGLFLFSHTRLASYGGTAWKKVREATKQQVPLEFEIERIRHEVAQLIPDMQKNLSVLAEEIVAVQNLKEEIDTTRVNLNKQKDRIHALKEDLKRGSERVVYDGRPYSVNRVRELLSRDLTAAQRCEQEIRSKEQLLEAKERALDAAREQLASMRSQKQELEVQVAQLEADVKTVRLAQTRSQFQLNDSRLSHIKGSLADLRSRLKVQQTHAILLGEFANDVIPVEKKAKSSEQLISEVETYLGENPKDESRVAAESRN